MKSLFIKDYQKYNQKLILHIFKNQFSNVRKINTNDPYFSSKFSRLENFSLDVQHLDSWRIFLRFRYITNLTLIFCGITLANLKNSKKRKINQYLQISFWRHLSKIVIIKKFQIQLTNKFDLDEQDFFLNLQKYQVFLANLVSFTIFLNHLKISQTIHIQFTEIFKHVTKLHIHELESINLPKILCHEHYFYKLSSLNVIKIGALDEEKIHLFEEEGLRYLKYLPQLKTLDLFINLNSRKLLRNFMEHFSVPSTISSISLNFYETCWEGILPGCDKTIEGKIHQNPFQSNKLCQTFYKKWEGLQKLENLSLIFTEKSQQFHSRLSFVTLILERISRLQNFEYSHILNDDSKRNIFLILAYYGDLFII